MVSRRCVLAWCLAVPLAVAPGARSAEPTDRLPPTAVVLLSEKHFCRKHYTFFPPRLAVKAAKALGMDTGPAARADYFKRLYASGLETPPPPADWARVGFDDSGWLLRRGRDLTDCGRRRPRGITETTAFHRGTQVFVEEIGLICQRGKFLVDDPRKVRKLTLSVTFRGGFVAYLNGVEIARSHLPAGKIEPTTPAEEPPLEAFFTKESIASGKHEGFDYHLDPKSGQWALRERTFGPKQIPLTALRRGENVLAVEFHRSDYPAQCKGRTRKLGLRFSPVGLSLLELKAEAGPGAARPAPAKRSGVEVWAADVTKGFSDLGCRHHDEKAGPVRIVAARNGRFSGQVLVTSTEPFKSVRADVSSFRRRGGGEIPVGAIRIRYGAVNPVAGGGLSYLQAVLPRGMKIDRTLGTRFDMLLDRPPAGASAVPVWVTVKVPKDAAAGRYAAALTIKANGAAAATVPLELSVADWTLPDVKDYVNLLNIYQSPDTLAEYYEVTPWSEKHWGLIDRSLKLIGQAGNIGLFFPLLAASQFGNPESMVLWVKQPDGTFTHDFGLFDRYLDTALKYHDRLRFLVPVVWGYECMGVREVPAYGAQVTVLDRATGKRSNVKLPEYGTPECEKMWRPLLKEVQQHLARRGLAKLMLLGLPGDRGPKASHVAMFRRILPDVRWIRESHIDVKSYRYDLKDRSAIVPVAYNSVVWRGQVQDPQKRRQYGWQHNPGHLVVHFPRHYSSNVSLLGFPPPWTFRICMEAALACGRNGIGRVGGDFFRIPTRRFPGTGRRMRYVRGGVRFGRYPASSTRQLDVQATTSDLFGPAPAGPVGTVRLENMLEGNQVAEARTFVEKALLDKGRPLPAELAERCQTLLDERTNVLRMWLVGAGAFARYKWQDRERRLYDLAGKVAAALRARSEARRPAEK